MPPRLSTNRNLFLHEGPTWNEHPVLTHRGSLVVNYLERIEKTLCSAISAYPRTLGLRCDLRIPRVWELSEKALMSKFFEALAAQIDADAARRTKRGKRVHPCRLRYVWVRERSDSEHSHYHVCIFLNRDAYFTLGRFKMDEKPNCGVEAQATEPEARNNMFTKITRAWASAMSWRLDAMDGLVHVPENAVYTINVNSPDFVDQCNALFKRLSYFAKADTKQFGEGFNNFGCSRS